MKRIPMEQAEHQSLAHIAGQLEFFSPLKGGELERILSHIDLYGYSSRETIFKKGEPSDALFIVHQGEVVIRLSPWYSLFRKVARLRPGNLFGEMSLLDNQPRSATAVARGETKLFVLLKRDFDDLLRHNPTFAEGLRWVADRRRFENRG